MPVFCHRCHGELSPRANDPRDDDDAGLFCPRCSAPQLMLPEHLRADEAAGPSPGGASTGTQPPPRVSEMRGVDWRAALTAGAGVAFVAAVLMVLGLLVSGVALLTILWVLSGAVISVGLYHWRGKQTRSGVRTNGRVGLRVGMVTGLLMLAALGISGAVTGVALRFGTHRLERFDEQSAEQAKQMQVWMLNLLAKQGQDQATRDEYVAIMNSPRMTAPEVRAGGALAQFGFQGLVIVLISAGGGAFAGMLQGRRDAVHGR